MLVLDTYRLSIPEFPGPRATDGKLYTARKASPTIYMVERV